MVPRSTIYKQKGEVLYFSFVSSYSSPFSLTFFKTTLRCSKSSDKKYNKDMRRRNSSWLNWKKQ